MTGPLLTDRPLPGPEDSGRRREVWSGAGLRLEQNDEEDGWDDRPSTTTPPTFRIPDLVTHARGLYQ